MSVIRVLKPVLCLTLTLVVTGLGHAEWKFSGYSQVRYNFWDNDLPDGDNSFDVRRARLTVEAPLNPQASFRAQIDLGKLDDPGGGDVELKELWLKRQLTPTVTAQLGYLCTPFGLEVPQSNATMLPLERSQAAEKLFPGQRDTGLYFHVKPTRPLMPALTVGYSNGLAKWYEVDKSGHEDTGSDMLLARAQWGLPHQGVAGVSYRHAARTRTLGGAEQDFSNDLWGLHARCLVSDRVALQGELYDGEELAADVQGWYVQAEYRLRSAPVATYYRHDVYDFGGSSDYFRNTLGAAWDLSKAERITLQAEDYRDGKGGDFTNFALQYQIVY